MAELATMARPRSVASTSSASWVIAASPAWCLRLALAIRNRNRAPSGSRISSHASSTVISRRRPRAAGSETRRQVASSASSVPIAFSSSGRSRSEKTTRCPAGRVVVCAANSAEWVPSV